MKAAACEQALWNGFRCREWEFNGKPAVLVFPDTPLPHRPLVIKTEYWNAFPDVEKSLVEKGFHLAYLKNTTRFATKADCDAKAAFIRYLAKEYDLSARCVLVGMSCGGAHAVRFAGFYPDLVSCMYLDAPVLNYCDFPGRYDNEDFPNVWQKEFTKAYPGIRRYQLLNFPEHPAMSIPALIQNKIPVIMAYGTEDPVVRYEQNGRYLEEAMENTGLLTVLPIPGRGHQHIVDFEDSAPVVSFLMKYGTNSQEETQ